MIPQEDGFYPDIDEQLYHADRGSLSVSGAKLILDSPAKFREQQDNPPPPKPAFDFGSLAHALVLGKGPELEILDPAVHGLKSDGTVADVPSMTGMWKKAAAKAREAGKLPVSADDYDAAQRMRDAVMEHPEAGKLFAAGVAEVSMYKTCEETGVRLRGRADWVTPDGSLVDLKTSRTADHRKLPRVIADLNYHMQASWYQRLAADGHAMPPFYFVFVEKEPPYLVSVVDLDEDALAAGDRLNRHAINTYAACVESGKWPGYSTGIETLALPAWAK